MDKAMKRGKLKICGFIFLLCVLAIVIGNAYAFNSEKSRINIVLDSCIGADGITYYISSDMEGKTELRKISPQGELLGFFGLRQNEGYIFYARKYLTEYENKIYLYEYENDTRSYFGISESIYEYDFETMTVRTLYHRDFTPADGIEDINILSMNIYDGEIYFTTYSGQTNENGEPSDVLMVSRVSIADSGMAYWQPPGDETVPRAAYDDHAYFASAVCCFNLGGEYEVSFVYYTKNGYLLFTTPDSKVHLHTGGDTALELSRISPFKPESLQTVYETIGRAALTSPSVGADGEMYIMVHEPTLDATVYKSVPAGDSLAFEEVRFPRNSVQNCVRMYFLDDSTFVGLAADQQLYLTTDNHSVQIESLRISPRFLLDRVYLLPVALETLVCLLLFALLYRRITRGKITIFMKQLVFSIPVLVVSVYVLSAFVEQQMYEQIKKDTIQNLTLASIEKLRDVDGEAFASIDWENAFEDEYYLELRSMAFDWSSSVETTTYLSGENVVYKEPTQNFTNYWFYAVRNNRVYVASCDQLAVNLPARYVQDPRSVALSAYAAENNVSGFAEVKDLNGEGTWLAVVTPIVNPVDGQVVGVIEVSMTTTKMEDDVAQNSRGVITRMVAVLIVIYLVFYVVLYFVLRTMKRLKLGATELMHGNYGHVIQCNSVDEVHDITMAFNEMSTQILRKMREMDLVNRGYYRFVPSAMFNILDKKSILDVELGNQNKIETTLLTMTTSGFQNKLNVMDNDAFFRFVNKLFHYVIPSIEAHDGVIEKYSESKLVTLYRDSSVAALSSAVEIIRKLKEFNAEWLTVSQEPVSVNFALHRSVITIGIIGHDNRFNTTIISDQIKMLFALEALGKQLGVIIMATDEIIAEAKDYKRRVVGYIQVKNEIIKLYDIFEADDYELQQAKKQTKGMFEDAIRLYYEGDFYNARAMFISIIKQSYYDLAAREYLVLCDSHLQKEEAGKFIPLRTM